MYNIKKNIIYLLFFFLITSCSKTVHVDYDTNFFSLDKDFKGSIFISSIVDNRDSNNDNKDRLIGRWRNGYGAPMGAIYLRENESIKKIIQDVVSQSFYDNGYRILFNKEDISKKTLILNLSIEKLWLDPGPFSSHCTINATISNGQKNLYIEVNEKFGQGNYKFIFENTLEKFYDEIYKKIPLLESK